MILSAKQNQFVNKKNVLIVIVLILHLVGALGSINSTFSDFFLSLTPLNLLISSLILIYSDSNSYLTIFASLLISFVLGFTSEVLGVQTGLIFGSYEYGPTLGIKTFDVPVIIGFNWFILIYISHHFFLKVKNHLIASILGAALMTMTDVLIEPVAVTLDYWQWEGGKIPTHNYAGWFLTSLGIHLILRKYFKSQSFNKLSVALFMSQIFYFIIIFTCY